MLEMIEFNNVIYRYRTETTECGIVYNLRYGTILIVKGKVKDIIEKSLETGKLLLNTEDKAINYLLENKVFVRKELDR